MVNGISDKELTILRDLAKKQLDYAKSDKMETLRKEWMLHNTFKGQRPMITVELLTFAGEIVFDMLQCESEKARNLEFILRSNLVNYELFGDDTVVRDYFPIQYRCHFNPFGIDVLVERQKDSVGHHFVPAIKDLKQDFHKLNKSRYGVNIGETEKYRQEVNEVLDGTLPVKLIGSALYAPLTQEIVHIMSMEDIYMSMYDYPDLFKQMMENLTNDYLEYFVYLENNRVILPTAGDEIVGQGTYCFTDELPADISEGSRLSSKDIWGFTDSQETTGVSAEMFEEFIFPYYKKLTESFGLLSYGCCEAVDPIWDRCLSKLNNMRKISISPWCNEEYMGEQLAGKKIIYHRKPSPNFLGVGTVLDEDALRKHISKTINAARGCKIEFTQRDVYTVNKDTDKVRRYVEILREESSA